MSSHKLKNRIRFIWIRPFKCPDPLEGQIRGKLPAREAPPEENVRGDLDDSHNAWLTLNSE